MALAHDNDSITLPHVIQEFKMNLGFLPAVWAADGDSIMVDDIAFAVKALSQFRKSHADVLFLTKDDIKHLSFSSIEPWGWNRSIRSTLLNAGINADILPSESHILKLRELSSRNNTVGLLKELREGIEYETCGESFYADKITDIQNLLKHYGTVVLKAPWSSSGRGIRYLSSNGLCAPSFVGWINNVIRRQGNIMIEPYYNKIKDFAMEFYVRNDGCVDFCGLSLFTTEEGCYKGNIIATEKEKRSILSRYISEDLLCTVRNRISKSIAKLLSGAYHGPLGVDMMIVADGKGERFLLDPCVEVNLRMTMGHVANSFKITENNPKELMRIVHDVNFRIKFEAMENNFVKVL